MPEQPEVHALLDRELPGLLGVIGTNSEAGYPHLVPVWYRWDGSAVHIWTEESRFWVSNLVRDPQVGFSVQEPEEPWAAVTLKGRASVETGDSQEIDAEIRRITRRYVPASEVQGYIRGYPGLRTIVHISPAKILFRSD